MEENVDSHQHVSRRRWLSFSIRGMLLLILVISVPLAWIGRDLWQSRLEEAVVLRVNRNYGSVTYDYQEENLFIPSEPPGNRLLRSIFGNHLYARVVSIVALNPLGNDTIVKFPDLRSLETLQLGSETLDDEAIEALVQIPKLQRLILKNTEITPQQLHRLAESRSIESIWLEQSCTTDDHLLELQHFPNLSQVQIWDSPATDTGLESLVAIKNLTDLAIVKMPEATDRSFSQLQKAKRLQSLTLSGTQMTDQSLRAIGQLTGLQHLSIGSSMAQRGVTSDGISQLKFHTAMTTLELTGSAIDDRSIETICSLPRLETLVLNNTAVTDQGIVPLKSASSLKHFYQGANSITPAGMQAIGFVNNGNPGAYQRTSPVSFSSP
ncbi:hypothetical protein [Blastopirellula marina]|uniref:Leucine Rich repeats (2 copies) n=1 Tax=Blastopirellula marina TaxID=124 RepID=A0A2S8FWM3_9BACT|nr:hypothetical protein [Blastopirellula marina]PQO36577.1 hypothetical protein C5Y98_11315 [Blastopirellula marina]PTL44407.1 hypothetical protein C5Y97_11325 [Blastopirellula marina]